MMISETERLLIRQLNLQDASFVLTLLNSPSWLKFIGDRNVRSLTDARNYLMNGPMASYETYGFGLYLITLKDDTPIGMTGLIKRDGLNDADIGFALLPEYTGQGYAYEAARAVLDYGYNQLHIPRIVAITTANNQHSATLLEKLGMRSTRTILLPGNATEYLLYS